MSDFKMGFPEVVGTLQAMANSQAGQLQDILEAVRALKPAAPVTTVVSDHAVWEELVGTRDENARLQKKVADQALTIATLKDELARTRHLLSEERALTAAISAHAAQP